MFGTSSPSLPFDGFEASYLGVAPGPSPHGVIVEMTGVNERTVSGAELYSLLSANGSTLAFLSTGNLTGENADGSYELFVTTLRPSLAVDGGPASCKQPTEGSFRFTGFGFSPDQPVQRFLRESNSSE